MTQASDIGWSHYGGFEGPFFIGRIPYAGPANPDFGDKCVAVVTATEGGHFDAVNMYDSCILTVGIIQVCERVFECSRMLGSCSKRNAGVLKAFLAKLPVPLDAVWYEPNAWHLTFADGSGPVKTQADMQRAYLGGSTGLAGQWTDDQKAFAKEVAAGFANVWADPDMRAGQADFIKPRLVDYVLPRAKKELFSDSLYESWQGAVKAMYVSYSANIPVVADKCLAKAMADAGWAATAGDGPANGQARFALLAKYMVRSGVGIWPNRYKAIVPALQRLFQVQPPPLEQLVSGPGAPATTTDEKFGTVASIQAFLVAHGYDLGPYGQDGVYGQATKQAVMKFQADHKLVQDGVAGPQTQEAMEKAAGLST